MKGYIYLIAIIILVVIGIKFNLWMIKLKNNLKEKNKIKREYEKTLKDFDNIR